MNAASFTLRFLVTLLLVVIAGLVAWQLWIYYMQDPWTRDGSVRADTVELAPDVSGPTVKIFVADNQMVHEGDPLFQIDPIRFKLAIAQAQANVMKAKAAMQSAQSTASRYAALSNNAVSGQSRDETNSAAMEAQADYAQAQADEAVAELNLARTTVRATVNGTVTNFSMQPGDYVNAGSPVIAIVDSDSIYIDGYFEETKLSRVALGDKARITLLDGGPVLTGHVAGIAAAITDAERVANPTLLAAVNPTFTWVRLARRIPVRITLDPIPPHTVLVAGMTCTVEISH
jgi:RND family efflux transporter MFP subunit